MAVPGVAAEAPAPARAVRTDATYMKVSPTVVHQGDINWFGTIGRHSARGRLFGTAPGRQDPSCMVAAGPPLDGILASREEKLPELIRRTEAGQRMLKHLSGR